MKSLPASAVLPTVIVLAVLFHSMLGSAAGAIVRECAAEEVCVQLALCGQYLHYVNEAPKYWPPSVRQEAINKLCEVQLSVNGSKIYYICCSEKDVLCGVSRVQLIAYGQEARPYAFPWMVLLESIEPVELPCGGSLINDRHVLTAAHCVKARTIGSVLVGVHDLNAAGRCDDDVADDYGSDFGEAEPDVHVEYSTSCAPTVQHIPIGEIVTHPKYSPRSKRNDLAVIRLQYPAIIGYSVIPICLPLTDQLRAYRPSDSFVTGWGVTESGERSAVLRYAVLPTMPLKECAMRIKELDGMIVLDESHLCAGGNSRSAHCQGDSGGPLQYISESSRFVLQGVVSFGLKTCGSKVAPGVFANVSNYIDWIVQEGKVMFSKQTNMT